MMSEKHRNSIQGSKKVEILACLASGKQDSLQFYLPRSFSCLPNSFTGIDYQLFIILHLIILKFYLNDKDKLVATLHLKKLPTN